MTPDRGGEAGFLSIARGSVAGTGEQVLRLTGEKLNILAQKVGERS